MQEFYDTSLDLTHFHCAEVGSTNDVAFDIAESRDLSLFWVRADRQVSGKGRSGRAWVSEKGNLYTSVLLRDPAPAANVSTLSFVAAVAMKEAIVEAGVPKNKLGLKWPNDVLVDGRKIVGILLEARQIENQFRVVIGMGCNITEAPADTPYGAFFLKELVQNIDAEQVASILRRRFSENLAVWARGNNFADIRSKWLSSAVGIGKPIRVRLPNDELHGVFKQLNEAGELVLSQAGGKEMTISAGDVFFT